MPLPAFWILTALLLGSAFAVITSRNAVWSALFLIVSLLGVATLYVTLRAEFLFAVQILVYTGGVMVLFLFVIMLVNIDHLEQVRIAVRRWWLAAAVSMVCFGGLAFIALTGRVPELSPGTYDPRVMSHTRELSRVLLTDYVLPFEILSILLLVAMVGAIVLARKES